MAKDPAFLFYDGDAARDVSHMNRLERGCYFDLIQAQRKFGGYTVEQARKILGKDFETCWSAIELILTEKNGLYFIEWVAESIEKRKEHAEKQRVRIQEYWDKKKKEEEPINNHGNTTVLPLVNENENENENEIVIKREKVNVIPSCDEFVDFILENDSTVNHKSAELKYKAWLENGWKDGYNKPIKNWKSKALNTIKYLDKNNKISNHDQAGQYVANRLRKAIEDSEAIRQF